MEKLIKIRNERHVTLFTVPDGSAIHINGNPYRLEFCDETHFFTISPKGYRDCFHIDEFGERVIGSGSQVEYTPENGVQEECFNYYTDEKYGGWIEVPLALAREMSIYEKFSWRSRQKGDKAYLEDTRDASLFRYAMEHRGRTAIYVQVREQGESQIRSYPHYGKEADSE